MKEKSFKPVKAYAVFVGKSQVIQTAAYLEDATDCCCNSATAALGLYSSELEAREATVTKYGHQVVPVLISPLPVQRKKKLTKKA